MVSSIPEPGRKQSSESFILEPIAENIPEELRSRDRWLCWRLVPDRQNAKPLKMPFNPRTGAAASIKDPADWASFELAWEAYHHGRYDGVGFVFTDEDDLVGADFDHVIDNSGTIDAETQEWIDRFASYTELSPSGEGLHVLVYGKLPRRGFKKDGKEIYGDRRYFTVTGHRFGETPVEIAENQETINAFIRKFFEDTSKRQGRKTKGPATFTNWDALRHELGERIKAHPTAHKNSSGNWDCQGVCHDGKGSTGLFYNPEKNQATCNAGCDQAAILLAFGLPEKPEGLSGTKQRAPNVSGAQRTSAEDDPMPAAPADTRINRTDEGNAQRLLYHFLPELRFDESSSAKWFAWTLKQWAKDSGSKAGERARRTVQIMAGEAAATMNEDQLRWAAASFSNSRIEAMLNMAKKMPEFIIEPHELDSDPMLLNVENGTLDLRTAVLREHRREDFITKLAPVEYHPEATAPRFEAFIGDLFGGDAATIADVQRLCGYSITGQVNHRVMPICHGRGSNGKSTLLELIVGILGPDYAAIIDPEILLINQFGTPSHELAALEGVRFAVADEIRQGRQLNEALIKRLTGGKTLHACQKYGHPFEFPITFKLWIMTNHKPEIRDDSDAIWDRIRLVPFETRFYREDDKDYFEGAKKVDEHMAAKLREERSGILNWLVQGCLNWQAQGLPQSEKVKMASRTYREESDLIGLFIEDCCDIDPQASIRTSELLKAFNEWRGGRPWRGNDFKPLMARRPEFEYKNTGKERLWLGLTIKGRFD